MHSSPRGVMANVPDCDIVASEFELKLYYYIYFQMNRQGMNSFIPSYELNGTITGVGIN